MNHKLLIIAILLLATFLRIYHLADRITFTIDEEYAANFALTILKDFHIIMTGMTVSVGFYMGPLFIYLTTFLLWISQLNPEFLGYVAAVNGVVTTFLLYIVGSKFFNRNVGVITALFYAVLPLVIFYDQRYWNNFPVPFISIALVGTLPKTKDDYRWWLIFALLAGVIFHTQVSIVPILFVGAFLFFQQVKKIPWRTILLTVGIFFILYSPLLAFDYFHNWDNLRLPFRIINSPQSTSVTGFNIPEHMSAFYTSLGRLWYLTPGSEVTDENSWGCAPSVVNNSTYTTPHWIISLIFLLILLIFFVQKRTWRSYPHRLLAISILVLTCMFMVFPGKPLEYYLLGLFPLLILVTAIVLDRLPHVLQITFCVGVVIFSTWVVLHAQTHFALGAQKQIIQEAMKKVGNQPFLLTAEGGCHQYQGWRYLFKVYGRTPTASYTDQMFEWLYPDEITSVKPEIEVRISEIRGPQPGYRVEYIYDKGRESQKNP